MIKSLAELALDIACRRATPVMLRNSDGTLREATAGELEGNEFYDLRYHYVDQVFIAYKITGWRRIWLKARDWWNT